MWEREQIYTVHFLRDIDAIDAIDGTDDLEKNSDWAVLADPIDSFEGIPPRILHLARYSSHLPFPPKGPWESPVDGNVFSDENDSF